MKKINFKKIKAKNFFCYGKEGIQIDFEKYKNIVLIKGKNLDISSDQEDDKHSSNGVGKSSIIDALVYGLFGKTVKNPLKVKQGDIINKSSAKQMEVEVEWDDYKVVRTRKPDSLRLWKEKEEITRGGIPATQKFIEDLLGLNYETFINISVFTDDNRSSFLECDTPEKRHIVENLLSLEKYRNYSENVKKIYKSHKENIKAQEKELGYVESQLSSQRTSLSSLESSQKIWKENKAAEIEKLNKTIILIDSEVEKLKENNSALKAYEDAQIKIIDLQKKIDEYEALVTKAENSIESNQTKFDEIKKEKDSISNDFISLQQENNSLEVKLKNLLLNLKKLSSLEDGVVCNHCHSTIDSNNYNHMIESHNNEIKELQTTIAEKKLQTDSKSIDLNKKTQDSQTFYDNIKKLKAFVQIQIQNKKKDGSEIETLKLIKKPESETKIQQLVSKKETIQEQLKEKELEANNQSPYESLIKEAVEKIVETGNSVSEKKIFLKQLNDKNKYYEFWAQAFGDSGIRKYVIDELIPALNDNINYWMQFLIEGNMQITFDNEFQETITKGPSFKDSIQYYALSSGQKRRVNLALSQGFAHVMSLSTGKSPNVIFLDEVTSNIDIQGVSGILSMINELSKDKQVWIITHNHDVLEALQDCDSVCLELKNGVSKLIS